jgi:type IV pilus assembly protein PilB
MLFAKTKKRLGELLVEAGLITQSALDQALIEHKKNNQKLGQYLIQQRLLSEEQLLDCLSKQLRIKRLNTKKFQPNPALKTVLAEEHAMRFRAAPLVKKGSLLLVAMHDPTDIACIDSLERVTRLEVEPVFCTESELAAIFHEIYGIKLTVSEEPVMAVEEMNLEAEAEPEVQDEILNISSMQSMAEDAPVVKIVNSILVQALNKRASDVHICPKKEKIELKLRVDGDLKEYPAPPKKYAMPMVSRLKLLSGLDISITRVPQDGRFTYRVQNKEISVRTSTLPTIYGEKVVLRLHVQSSHGHSLDDLGMSEKEREMIEAAITKPYGLILATGPTGSGKTTLLYSILQKVISPNINVVTLEDPVESRFEAITQVQLNSKAGMTFASGLRSILRQDPDVIMIGEIRDQETASIAIQAAMTGHQVLSTLHTNDAAGAVSRFVEMGIEPFLISSTLLVVVAQRLVRRICPECIEPYEAPDEQLRAIIQNPTRKLHFFRGRGCFACDNTGFKGRMGVFEILTIDNKVQEMILRRASAFEIKQTMVRAGNLRTLKMDAAYKVFQGLTTFEEYLTVAF